MDQASGSVQPGTPPLPDASAAAEPSPLLTWPKTVQMALCLLVTAGSFFLLGRWSMDWSRPVLAAPYDSHGPCLDLNRATQSELRLLPGLGDALAERIIAHRVQHGSFQQVDDLEKVSGIGPKTLHRLRPLLFVSQHGRNMEEEGKPLPLSALKPAPKSRAATTSKTKQAQLTHPIDINHANQSELQKLPGIGPKMSQRIIDARKKARFEAVDDLRRVSGIGPKTLEKLRNHVTIGASKLALAE